MRSDRRRNSTGWRLTAMLVVVLFAAACTPNEQSQDGEFPTLEDPLDSDQTSTTSGSDDPPLDPGSESDDAPPPTLTLPEPGDSGSPSNTVSAIPGGLEVGFTDDGYPYRGSPDAAITLIEYSDYACPFCGRYTAENVPTLLEQYGITGDVRFVFRDLPLVSLHPTAPTAHTAAICAGEQSADLYWAIHDEIFVRQADWTNLSDPADFLAGLAAGIGVELNAYQDCVESGRSNAEIDASVTEAQALGFNGTPTFQLVADGLDDTYTLVGAQPLATFQSYLDSLLAGEAPEDAQASETSEPAGLPFWADVATGLRPDPDRPGVNLAGDHYKGNPDASLVVVEFSDFECPFCSDHALEKQPVIDAALVDTGDVLWVFKHLPLDAHPDARVAAVAAECAGDQGHFWEMHDLLFASISEWAGENIDVDEAVLDLVNELPLDTAGFEDCFASRVALERVLDDMSDARGIISQTPSFVIIQGERGSLMQGSIPADEFIASLQGRLEDQGD